jgi:hypothetical protein
VLDVAVAQISLKRPGIDAIIGDRALCGVDSPLRGFIADASFSLACFLSPFLESSHASIISLMEVRRETGRPSASRHGRGGKRSQD